MEVNGSQNFGSLLFAELMIEFINLDFIFTHNDIWGFPQSDAKPHRICCLRRFEVNRTNSYISWQGHWFSVTK